MSHPVRGRRFRAFVLVVSLSVCACAGSTVEGSEATDWPLWAYGVTTLPQPGDTAKPQRAPGPWFRPDLPREEQLRPLQIEGSSRRYTMLELNDWQHTPDWFPEEHGPVPVAISRGPASLGDHRLRKDGFYQCLIYGMDKI